MDFEKTYKSSPEMVDGLERHYMETDPRDDLLTKANESAIQMLKHQFWKKANYVKEQDVTQLTLDDWIAIVGYIYRCNRTLDAETKYKMCSKNLVLRGMEDALRKTNPALTAAQAEQKRITFDKPYLERMEKKLPFRWLEWVEYYENDFTLADSESPQGSPGSASNFNNPLAATSGMSGLLGIEGHGQTTLAGPNQLTGTNQLTGPNQLTGQNQLTGPNQLNHNAAPYKHAQWPPAPNSARGEQALPPTYYQYISPPPPYVPTSVTHDQVKSQGGTQTVITAQPSLIRSPFAIPSSSEPSLSQNSFSKQIFQNEFDMKPLGGGYEWDNCIEWVCCWGEKFSAWMDKRDRERGFIRTKFSIPQPSRRPARRRPCPCEGGTRPHMNEPGYR